MTGNNATVNGMDVMLVINTEKLPDDIIEILKQLSEGKLPNKDKKEKLQSVDKKHIEISKLLATQTGTVVGNIYTDKIYEKEKKVI